MRRSLWLGMLGQLRRAAGIGMLIGLVGLTGCTAVSPAPPVGPAEATNIVDDRATISVEALNALVDLSVLRLGHEGSWCAGERRFLELARARRLAFLDATGKERWSLMTAHRLALDRLTGCLKGGFAI